MSKIILSWLCYWLGDLVSQPMRWDGFAFLNPAYQRLMCWSDTLQGDDPRGPWSRPPLSER